MGRRRRALLVGLVLVVGVAMVWVRSSRPARHRIRQLVVWAVDRVRIHQRLAAVQDETPLGFLAASQVGYGPSMQKEFTSHRPFKSFVVEDADGGRVVWTGSGPVREVATSLLGPVDRVWFGDFSAFQTSGRYRLRADNGLTSRAFSIGPEVFDAPLRAVQRWFYYQRAFTAVAAPYAEGPWVHPDDREKAPPGIEAGWHDAGDFSVYSASLNPAVFWLLSAAADFTPRADDLHLPESGNGVPDLLDEARWGLRWLLSVQDAAGGFQNNTCQHYYGRYGTNRLERAHSYHPGEVGTLATGRAVGTLAFASVVYRKADPAFADRCLVAARNGVRYLDAHPIENTDGPTCPAARRDGDAVVGRSVRAYAAAGMFLATGERVFRDRFAALRTEPVYDPPFLSLDGHAALLYLRARDPDPELASALRARIRANAGLARTEGQSHPFHWASRYHWGSIGAAFLRASLSSAPECVAAPVEAAGDCEQAMASLHYAFGRNFLNFSYVGGVPGVERGMKHSFHQWLAALDESPHNFPGMIAGGPNLEPPPGDGTNSHARSRPVWGYWGDPALPRTPSTPVEGRYTDNDSWSTNEASVEWEAEGVYLLHLARWLAGRPAPAR